MKEWKKQLTELKHAWLEKEAPQFYAASGGKTMVLRRYSDTNTNALTNAVMDWLKFYGCYANRINSMGIYRAGKYTPSGTRKGTADLNCIINAKSVAIEIKCKATRDRMSDDQHREKERIEAAGGIYYVCTDMDSFTDWFESLITSETSINTGK